MSSSRDGDRSRTADAQSGKDHQEKGGAENDEARKSRGVTEITEEQDPIAAALRRVYNDAAKEPLPDGLSALLSRLEAAEKDK